MCMKQPRTPHDWFPWLLAIGLALLGCWILLMQLLEWTEASRPSGGG
jgi:hypothetical protein